MNDIVLDTCFLGEFLIQYFSLFAANRGYGRFRQDGRISRDLARRLNQIRESRRLEALVVASSFAFVELARSWDGMIAGRLTEAQLYAFINQPPEWFDIAPVDEDFVPYLFQVSKNVRVDGELHPIELPDAIHVAATFSRGSESLLATTDGRLRSLPRLWGRTIS